ncbi:alpha/beta fold hydrolase [Frigidibacter sp. RF13]|uniref:alpha/beta fold hydrolase n=1 Tax=Frigidibacter sp. RF13 TaxID=2997340 RepID=UPI0022701260|nr:alpha/beta fold hydrolase [Frigidibacter sp. RF13]MCY1126169.1 alpha/beta fold hydrolase [Frigidibacter sp. RF13]
MLNRIEAGNDGAFPPLLIVHGLFGSARNWGAIQKRMAADRRVVAVDQRNHGESFRAATQSYHDMADDIAEVIESEGRSMDVVGHSMGGKAAMMLALTRPELVYRLVVADIAPVAYGHSNRHLVHAMQALDLEGLTARSEADRRLQTSVTDPGTRAFLLQSLDLKEEPPRWRLNLPVLDAEMDKIVGWPEGVSGTYDGPVMFLSGAASDYMRPEYRAGIKKLFPSAVMAKIPGAGHWLHAEKPREFEAALRAFLK